MGNEQSGNAQTANIDWNEKQEGSQGRDRSLLQYSNISKVGYNFSNRSQKSSESNDKIHEGKGKVSSLNNIEDKISLRWLRHQPGNVILQNFNVLSIGARIRIFHKNKHDQKVLGKTIGNRYGDIDEKDVGYITLRLLHTAVFSSFSEAELKSLASKFEKCQYLMGTNVIKEGDRGNYFYLVRKGRLKVYSKAAYVLNELVPGNTFGEVALIIPEKKRSASVQCLTHCALYRLHSSIFMFFFTQNTSRLLGDAKTLLSKIHPFDKLETKALLDVAKRCYFTKMFKDELLLKTGEPAKNFYLVVEGSVVISGGGMKHLKVHSGSFFGERSLLSNEPIAKDVNIGSNVATFLVLKPVDFLALPKNLHHLFDLRLTKLQLSTHAIMKHFDQAKKDEVIRKFKTIQFKNGEKIIQEGKPGDNFFIVKSGKCCVLKYITRRKRKSRKVAGPEVHSKVVGYLTVNDIFGEIALLNQNSEKPTLATATVVAINTVCCFVLGKKDFLRYFENNEYFLMQQKAREEKNNSLTLAFCELCDFESIGNVFYRPFCVGTLVQHTESLVYLLKRSYVKYELELLNLFSQCQKERQIMLELQHPFISRLVCTLQDGAHVYFLEEYNIGGDVLSLMERHGGSIGEALSLKIASCVLLALSELRLRNILCRQLAPENIFLDANGYAKLGNFSRAKKLSVGSRTMTVFGVPEYMPPEQIFGAGQDTTSDLWQFGVLIYEMLMGNTPFQSNKCSTGRNSVDDSRKETFSKIILGINTKLVSMLPSADVQVVVQQLLLPQSQARLGASDLSDLYASAWFMAVNFNKLYERDASGLPSRAQSVWNPEVELGNPMKYYGKCANRLTVLGGTNSRFDPSKRLGDEISFGDSNEVLDDSTCDSERRWFHEF